MLAKKLIWSFLSSDGKKILLDWMNINNSNNQKFFIEVAKNHEYWKIRLAAVKKITNHNILADIVKYEKVTIIREAAYEIWKSEFKKLTDQTDLSKIAKTHVYSEARLAAVKKITDQNILTEIAKNGEYADAQLAVVRMLNDQNLLTEIFKNDNNSYVRIAALDKLTDQNPLTEIAKNDKDVAVRKAAVSKLKDQKLLAKIAKNDPDYYIREEAKHKINELYISSINDQNVLIDIAKNEKDSYKRKAAFGKLIDQNLLAEIAKNDKDVDVRKAAVEKLSDQVILVEIAKNGKDFYVRRAALEKLTNVNDLGDLTANLIEDFQENYNNPRKREIADLLYSIYRNNHLSQRDKSKILQLNGKLICYEKDFFQTYHTDEQCTGGHGDYVKYGSKPNYFRL